MGFCPAQPAWDGAATWQGEVCYGSNTTFWRYVSCQGGRVTAVNLNVLSASGPLEGFGQLTALTDLRLASNRFSGARAAASCTLALQRDTMVLVLSGG